MIWNRPVKWKSGWTKLTIDEAIKGLENKLWDFSKTPRYDSGVRLHCVEAYLQGLIDSKKFNTTKPVEE